MNIESQQRYLRFEIQKIENIEIKKELIEQMEQNRQDLEEVMVLEEEVKGLKNKVEVWILDICKDIRKDQNRV